MTHRLIVSTKETSRNPKTGNAGYKVRHIIDGLSEEQAWTLDQAISGRLTSLNFIDIADSEGSSLMSDIKVGDEFISNR